MLTGSITFPHQMTAPNGLAFNIGDDGGHYLACYNPVGPNVELGCAETNTRTNILTQAQWRTDFASFSPGVTGTFTLTQVWPAPGTNQFLALGYSYFSDNSTGRSVAVGVWYTITDPATIVAASAVAYSCAAAPGLLALPDVGTYQFAAAVIGTNLYAVNRMDDNTYLSKVALAGGIDLTSGSWAARNCAMPFGNANYYTIGSRLNTNRSSIIQDPNGIGVFFYATPSDGIGYTQSKLLYCVVATLSMALFSGSADRSSEFGIPFADDGKNLANSVSGNSLDQYTSPSITGTVGNEVIFGRSYSDGRQTIGMRRFTQDLSTGAVVSLGASTFQGTADVFASAVAQVQFQRESGVLNTVMDNQTIFHFAGLADVAPPPTPGPGRRLMATPGPYTVRA